MILLGVIKIMAKVNIEDRMIKAGVWKGHPLFKEAYAENNICTIDNDSYYVNYSVSNISTTECNIDFTNSIGSQTIVLIHGVSNSSFTSASDLTTYKPDYYWLSINNITKRVTLYYSDQVLFYITLNNMSGKYRIRSVKNIIKVEKDYEVILGPLSYLPVNTSGYGGFLTTSKNLIIDNFKIYGKQLFAPSILGKTFIFEDIIFVSSIDFNGNYIISGSSSNGKSCIIILDSDYNISNIKLSNIPGIITSDSLLINDKLYITGGYEEYPNSYPSVMSLDISSTFGFLAGKYINTEGYNDQITSITSDTSNNILISIENKIIKLDENLTTIEDNKSITNSSNNLYISDMIFDSNFYYVTGGFNDGTNGERAYILKLDSNLNKIACKLMELNTHDNYIYFGQLIKDSTSGFICLGGISNKNDENTSAIIVKIDTNLNIINNRSFKDSLGLFELNFNNIFELNGEIYINGSAAYLRKIEDVKLASFWKMFLIKLDSSLNTLYSKLSYASNNKIDEAFTRTLYDQDNNRIMIHGEITDPAFTFQKHYFMSIEPEKKLKGVYSSDDYNVILEEYSLDSTSEVIISSDSDLIQIFDSTCSTTDFNLTFSDSTSWISENMFTINGQPQEPSNVIGSYLSSDSAEISWNYSPTLEEDGFYIERSTGGLPFEIIGYVDIDKRRYFDNTLMASTLYQYQVRAYNIMSESNASNIVNITTPDDGEILLDPTNLLAELKTLNGIQNIELTWNGISTNEDGFYLDRKLGTSGDYIRIATLSPGSKNYLDANLNLATQYFYRVQAFNSGGSSNYSTTSIITESSFSITKSPNNIYSDLWTNSLYFYNINGFSSRKIISPDEILEIPLKFDLFPMNITLLDSSVISNITFTAKMYCSNINSIYENSNIYLLKNNYIIGTGIIPSGTAVDTSQFFQYIYNGTLADWGISNEITMNDFRSNIIGSYISLINNNDTEVTLYIDGFSLTINWNIPITY